MQVLLLAVWLGQGSLLFGTGDTGGVVYVDFELPVGSSLKLTSSDSVSGFARLRALLFFDSDSKLVSLLLGRVAGACLR